MVFSINPIGWMLAVGNLTIIKVLTNMSFASKTSSKSIQLGCLIPSRGLNLQSAALRSIFSERFSCMNAKRCDWELYLRPVLLPMLFTVFLAFHASVELYDGMVVLEGHGWI